MFLLIPGLFAQQNEISQKIFGHWSILPNMRSRENIDYFYNSKSFFIFKRENNYRIVFPWAFEGTYFNKIITITENEFDIYYNFGDNEIITKIKFIDDNTIIVSNLNKFFWFTEEEILYYRIDIIKSFYLDYRATHITKRNDVKIYEFPNIDSKYRIIGKITQVQVFTKEQIEVLKANGMEGLENLDTISILRDGTIGHFVLISTGVYGWCFIEDLEEI
jgi:hypothetical protein